MLCERFLQDNFVLQPMTHKRDRHTGASLILGQRPTEMAQAWRGQEHDKAPKGMSQLRFLQDMVRTGQESFESSCAWL